jgi:hypothetical protein
MLAAAPMKTSGLRLTLALVLPVLCLAACGDDSSSSGGGGDDTTSSATSAGDGGAGATTTTGQSTSTGDSTGTSSGSGSTSSASTGAGGAPSPVCTEPTDVPCEDQVFLEMNLKDDPAPGDIENEPEGTGFHTSVDATAGGAFNPDPHSYVYGRFTEDGLEKVDISDEESIESMDWDIAFRRYVIRINSGNSGPSCVGATRMPGEGDYDATTAPPDGATFRGDEYFTDSCEIIADGTGLPNSPATALSSFWSYPGCVQMTGYVFVVQLADGRLVKLIVDNYYDDESQAQCQKTDTAPKGENGSGSIQLRWAFL